jgi:phage terminase small subunit
MPKPRTPTKLLQLKGAFKVHPERKVEREGEPEGDGLPGDPPDTLTPAEQAAWREIVSLAYPGTLSSGDRLALEYGATLLVYLRQERYMVPAPLLGRWEAFLAKFGMTPADRSRVKSTVKKKDDDGISEFQAAA